MMPQELVDAMRDMAGSLREISDRLQRLENSVRDLTMVTVEMSTRMQEHERHTLDSANRHGTQIHRHSNEIVRIDSEIAKLRRSLNLTPSPG
jgi:predicted RNase H-like nuclease (RuvC/YqgF family)